MKFTSKKFLQTFIPGQWARNCDTADAQKENNNNRHLLTKSTVQPALPALLTQFRKLIDSKSRYIQILDSL